MARLRRQLGATLAAAGVAWAVVGLVVVAVAVLLLLLRPSSPKS